MKVKEKKNYVCEICGRVLNTKSGYLGHKQIFHGVKTVIVKENELVKKLEELKSNYENFKEMVGKHMDRENEFLEKLLNTYKENNGKIMEIIKLILKVLKIPVDEKENGKIVIRE